MLGDRAADNVTRLKRGNPRRGWVLPAMGAVAAAVLGVATNLATNSGSKPTGWVVVGLLIIISAVAAVLLDRRGGQTEPFGGGVVITSLPGSETSEVRGLVKRIRETSSPDGSVTKTIEYFGEERADRTFRERLDPDDE